MTAARPSSALTALHEQLAMKCREIGDRQQSDEIRLACWMLNATRPWPLGVADTLQSLLDAHRDAAADPSIWRRLRTAAVAISDGNVDGRLFGKVAEAAAWPVSSSGAGLVELMQAICSLRGAQAAAATGWTIKDQAVAQAKLEQIARGNGDAAPKREDIPGLFEAEHPELARRFTAQLQASNMAFSAFRAEVAAWLAGAAR